jgi:hypothetical protein
MIRSRFLIRCLLRLCLLTSLTTAALAVGSRSLNAKVDPLFAANEVLEIRLSGPLKKISRDRKDEPELRPGELSYLADDGQEVVLAVELEPRGKSRRDREVCTFPPLWVHFDKEEVKGTLFKKQRKLKMVTYCRSSKNFQDYIVKEYLAYRILNELTDTSFRVRLLKISFDESENDKDPLVRYGFFIEHKKRLAKRIDSKVMEPTARIPSTSLVPEQTTIAELFQYLVSNTDYSFIAPPLNDDCCHNTVLFDAGDGKYLPVPYDFDRTGLVSPPNGQPDGNLGQRSFRDRVYRGFCRDEAVMAAALDKTREARASIDQLIAEQMGLSDRGKATALKFVAGYYQVIDDDKRRARGLKCRKVQRASH